MNSEVFHSGCWQQALSLAMCEPRGLFPFILRDASLSRNPMYFLHRLVLVSTVLNTQGWGGPFADLCSSHSVWLFLSDSLPYKLELPWLPCTQLNLLNAGGLLTSLGCLLPKLPVGNSLQAVNWALTGFTSFVSHFSGTSVLCYLVSSVFTTVAFYICAVFSCLRHYRVNALCHSTLDGSKSQSRFLKKE